MNAPNSEVHGGYFPGMEPSRSDVEQQPTNSYLHDMTPGPSLAPEVDDVRDVSHQANIDRY